MPVTSLAPYAQPLRELPPNFHSLDRQQLATLLLREIRWQLARELKAPAWAQFSLPYALALAEAEPEHDMYGADPIADIILYLLSNLAMWRGEVAREVKTRLNQMAAGRGGIYP